MAATRRNVNWGNVSFTPSGGTATPIINVQDVQYDPRGKLISGSGDNDRMPSYKGLVFRDPRFTVITEDTTTFLTLSEGVKGTFTATHLDAGNGIGSGALTYTVAYAIIGNAQRGGPHQQFGRGTLEIECWSPDGQTPPVSVTIAP